jgi:hypothetical protein
MSSYAPYDTASRSERDPSQSPNKWWLLKCGPFVAPLLCTSFQASPDVCALSQTRKEIGDLAISVSPQAGCFESLAN